jgi:hypothetical protein
MTRKRFLTICEGGAVRSVSLATVLRWDFQQDAIPLSAAKNGPEAVDLLCAWADYIILMQPTFETVVPKRFHLKIRILDVGPDVWGNPMHPVLRDIVGSEAQKWKDRGWLI